MKSSKGIPLNLTLEEFQKEFLLKKVETKKNEELFLSRGLSMPALINPGNDQFSVINFLPHQECTGYSLKVAAKSAAGRRNPCYLKAILHAPGVFFCVAALTHLKFMVWWLIVFFYFLRHIIRIMVVQAGQLSGWPVADCAGFSPPPGLPPIERENSGGGKTINQR